MAKALTSAYFPLGASAPQRAFSTAELAYRAYRDDAAGGRSRLAAIAAFHPADVLQILARRDRGDRPHERLPD